ncbi:MAG: 30S ribosomal protein S4 [Firmicutes bacterium]|nr:30S ribosomal protein S4 [Bacillota bacterium]MDY5041635.1 30S ribosomal protein S4 [Eubacteriales bacterium]
MAKYTGADCKICRREGCKLFLKGERCLTKKCSFERRPNVPGVHGAARKKITEYGLQLREKQKVKRAYGLQEKQFRGYYEKASTMRGKVGENMLSLLERRLDNVVYRMGIGASRAESRQIVNHGHITVNGKNVNIPSYLVNVDDVIAVKENKRDLAMFKDLKDVKVVMPKWLEFDNSKLTGKINALPQRDDIDLNVQEHLIIELYSK